MHGRLPVFAAAPCKFAAANSPLRFFPPFAASTPNALLALAAIPPAKALTQNFRRVKFPIFHLAVEFRSRAAYSPRAFPSSEACLVSPHACGDEDAYLDDRRNKVLSDFRWNHLPAGSWDGCDALPGSLNFRNSGISSYLVRAHAFEVCYKPLIESEAGPPWARRTHEAFRSPSRKPTFIASGSSSNIRLIESNRASSLLS